MATRRPLTRRGVAPASRQQLSATREIEKQAGKAAKHGTSGDFIDIIKGIGGGIVDAITGGGGPQTPPPRSFPPPGGSFPPVTGGGGGGGTGGACGSLPEFLQAACRRIATGGNGGGGGGGGGGQPGTPGLVGPTPCPNGTIRVGDTCVSPGDLFPGGAPGTFPAGGGAVQGAFGLPAMTPAQEQRTRLNCPEGMVLGKDNLCYPKAILSRRSRFRKWRPAPRAKITAAEWKTLKKAARVKDEAKDVAKEAGWAVKKK